MSFATLPFQAKAAFIAGQCAARRDRWMIDARNARKNGFKAMSRTMVSFARDNSRELVSAMRKVRMRQALQ